MDNKSLGISDDLVNIVKGIVEKKLHPNQKKLDVDGDGELEASDFKKLRGEDVDQLDELSKDTLGSYIQAAGNHRVTLAHAGDKVDNDARKIRDVRHNTHDKEIRNALDKSETAKEKESKDISDKSLKRFKGIHRAISKLTKEQVEEQFDEEFDQVDELSKKTLGSYIHKASRDQIKNGARAEGDRRSSSDYKNAARAGGGDGDSKLADKYEKSASDAGMKAFKRDDGIKKAVSKLTKEQVDEIEALAIKHGLSEGQIDEELIKESAENALSQAAKHKTGSEEYHKWMSVHHLKASKAGGKNKDFHETQAEHHASHVNANSKEGRDFHEGESHHWK